MCTRKKDGFERGKLIYRRERKSNGQDSSFYRWKAKYGGMESENVGTSRAGTRETHGNRTDVRHNNADGANSKSRRRTDKRRASTPPKYCAAANNRTTCSTRAKIPRSCAPFSDAERAFPSHRLRARPSSHGAARIFSTFRRGGRAVPPCAFRSFRC